MSHPNIPDACVGRIVVEFSKKYTTLYLCNDSGRVLDWDAFNHATPLEVEDATDERDTFFHILYDYANTIVNDSAEVPDDDKETRSEKDNP